MMIYVVFEGRFVDVVEGFQNILNLLQVIAIVAAIFFHRIERCINFQPHDVACLMLGIERPFAAIACVVDHSLGSFVSFDLYELRIFQNRVFPAQFILTTNFTHKQGKSFCTKPCSSFPPLLKPSDQDDRNGKLRAQLLCLQPS
jgi:hypothetical protein